VICDAFKHACRELDADLKVRRVLLKLFDDHVLDDIRAVYKAVNALLVRNSILPRSATALRETRRPVRRLRRRPHQRLQVRPWRT